MEQKKLNRIFVALLGLLFIVVVIAVMLPEDNNDENNNGNSNSDVSSNSTFQASKYNSKKLVQDYLNPTEEEKREVASIYGSTRCYFDTDGLHVKKKYESDEETLITDVWPERDLIKNIVKPEMDIFEIELSRQSFKIIVENVSERDLKKYINEIKKEYKNEKDKPSGTVLFSAYSDNYTVVKIKYNELEKQGTIQYRF